MAAGDITVVGTDKSTENNTGSSTVQWTDLGGGSAPAANDLCVLFSEHSTAATETVIPTSQGFTQVDNQTDGVSSLTAYKKVCTGSESGSITVTTSVAGRKTLWGIVLRGALDVHVLTKGGDTGTDANHTPPAATPTVAGCGAIIALGEHGGTAVSATPPSGYTELLEGLISGTNPSFAYLAYKGSAGLLDKLTISVAETPGNIVSNASGSDVTYMTLLISPSQTPIAASDTGSGADAATLAVTATATDTASAANAATLTATGSAADTAASIDAAALTTAITAADSATATDTAVSIGLAATDAGSGADAATLAASVGGSDTGTGTDSVTLGLAATDTGHGADAATLAAALSTPDTAHGTDTATLAATAAAADTASALDAALLAVAQAAADAATGTDAASLSATLSAADTATGVDVGSTPGADTPKSGTDTVTATDSASVTSAGITAADTAHAVDSASVMVLITTTDNATATDLAMLAAGVAAADLASALDAGAVFTGTTGTPVDNPVLVLTAPQGQLAIAETHSSLALTTSQPGLALDETTSPLALTTPHSTLDLAGA